MNKRLVLFLILITIIVLGIPLFFLTYPAQVNYYIESDYDKFSRIIFIPILVGSGVLITYKSVKQDVQRDVFKILEYIKQTPGFILGFVLLYFLTAITFNGFLLFLNINLGSQKMVQIRGKVIEEYVYLGTGKSKSVFELTILNETDKKLYKFTTQKAETDRYKINNKFEKKMRKGLFGFIYLK
ncbi:MAG: hypothetical protein ABWZ56_08650 [Flavobacterium sp.]